MQRTRPHWLATGLLILAASACPPPPEPPPQPEPEGGAAPYDATCGGACDRWRDLGCKEAEPSPDGASCEDVCENVQGSGIIEWDLACRASVATCDAIDRCER